MAEPHRRVRTRLGFFPTKTLCETASSILLTILKELSEAFFRYNSNSSFAPKPVPDLKSYTRCASEELSAQAEQMNDVVGELVAMVGGAGQTSSKSNTGNTAKKTHELVAEHHGLSKSDNVFHSIANKGTTQKAETRVATKAAAAKKTIPMNDDDSSSDDIKDFNS